MDKLLLDTLWLLLCSVLVLLMQAGFLALESGATRTKNAINVALKNAADLLLALFLFWLVGFGIMFGQSVSGWFGSDHLLLSMESNPPWLPVFFLFQAMFCATAATIVSGAVAERVRFNGYLLMTAVVVVVIYPVAGHWIWGGAYLPQPTWLAEQGFVDFAGSTLVHSLGGWVALAALLLIGPRQGRFSAEGGQTIPASNLPLSMLGVIFFLIGWIGFNGGSLLELNSEVALVVVHTLLAAVSGGVTAWLVSRWIPQGRDEVLLPLNGILAGLVSVTASAHAIGTLQALLIGAVGAVVMVLTHVELLRRRIDDAIGAVPVHLAAGIWGTIAVALFGDSDKLATGLSASEQLWVQLQGIVIVGVWAFGLSYLIFGLINRYLPLRVSREAEAVGLNISEHGARTPLLELLQAMDRAEAQQDLTQRLPEEPFTEVGQIAARHNLLMEALEQAIATTRAIVRDIRDGIVTFNSHGELTSFNPGAERLFGYTNERVMGESITTLFDTAQRHLPFRSDGEGAGRALFEFGEQNQICEFIGKRADNTKFAMEFIVSQSRKDGESLFTGLIRDVTERRKIEDKLFQEKEQAQITLESIIDGVITTDQEGRVAFVNSAAERMTGWPNRQAKGIAFEQIYDCRDEVTEQSCSQIVQQVIRSESALSDSSPRLLRHRDGTLYAVHHAASPLLNRKKRLTGVVVVFHDITRARQMQAQLSYQASHDSLTGLKNRAAFESAVANLLTHLQLDEGEHIIGYLDLDQFKLVNDTCGHIAGDQLLTQVAKLLQSCLREHDLLARLGGDEFGVLLHNASVEAGVRVAERMREAIASYRFPWQERQFSIGVSIGLVTVDLHCESLGQLLSRADTACYAAKDLGRNRVHVYDINDGEVAQRQGQMHWAQEIRQALDSDRFRLYCQRIEPLHSSERYHAHYEILVRMVDHSGQIIPPGAFIPAAERYNLMVEIDQWVVRNTLAWQGDMERSHPEAAIYCAINLSGSSIGTPACLQSIRSAFKGYGANPERVTFEITETAAIANLDAAIHFIQQLKQIGCRFALDDFGSGLSSFGYLRNLAVDYLKIDGSFIREIESSQTDRALVESINHIGHVMGLQTIAEFVENSQIESLLREMGVDYAQGYHIGHPKPLEELGTVRRMGR
ncbi:ammonium transporter [Ectothiorhodospiraceae bacterium BW-2]|nr:ammonium transporter [Ectothiorhodospiraceae bacterium BW-2]